MVPCWAGGLALETNVVEQKYGKRAEKGMQECDREAARDGER